MLAFVLASFMAAFSRQGQDYVCLVLGLTGTVSCLQMYVVITICHQVCNRLEHSFAAVQRPRHGSNQFLTQWRAKDYHCACLLFTCFFVINDVNGNVPLTFVFDTCQGLLGL